MTHCFVHERRQVSPGVENSAHQALAVFLEVVTLPEPAKRRIHVRIGRPPHVATWIGGTPLLGKGRPVAFQIRPDSANQVPMRRETRRIAIPFQSHIRVIRTLGPFMPTETQSWPTSNSMKKRLDAGISDLSIAESRVKIATALETGNPPTEDFCGTGRGITKHVNGNARRQRAHHHRPAARADDAVARILKIADNRPPETAGGNRNEIRSGAVDTAGSGHTRRRDRW